MPARFFAPGLLDGRVVVVPGGGSGLGRATAVELTACGARVVVAGRRPEPLDETVALCEGERCEPLVCDIREEEQVNGLVDGVLERHGRIDTLVNNAGGQYMSPAEDLTPKGFETVVRLNLIGTWLITHAAATKAMIPAGGGKIVNVTLSPHHGLPGMAHSSAARAAVENLTRVLSIEWARFQIKLTAIAAGHFETEALEKYPDAVRPGAPRALELTTAPLALQPNLARRASRPRRPPPPRHRQRRSNPRAQPLQRQLPVPGLRARVLRDRGDPRAAARHHPPLLPLAQRLGRRHVEDRLDPGGGDVRVLPAGARRPAGAELDLAERDRDPARHRHRILHTRKP